MEQMRCQELIKRPGDSPELIQCMIDAIEAEKQGRFEEGMKMLFGRPCDPRERCYWEFEGKE